MICCCESTAGWSVGGPRTAAPGTGGAGWSGAPGPGSRSWGVVWWEISRIKIDQVGSLWIRFHFSWIL